MAFLARWQHLLFPLGIIASVLVLMVPLPAPLVDMLLAANLAVAVIVLLTTLYVKTPLEFSVFPAVLLATTLSRLVLNVASTRLILTRAESDGLNAAGHVIRAFGEFVAGDNIIVGLVIFSIIVVIQFVVITKGATRISEVAARFALDGMPGRQMAIDADLAAGAIDERTAKRLRQEVTEQADFHAAMDGASKFVRGDAVAGMLITAVNIIGGMVIGVFQSGMSLSQAASLFTKLTVGDGLVSQTPAFLISVAAGMLVTRSSRASNLPNDVLLQLFSRPEVLIVAAGFSAILMFTGLPFVPLLIIAAGLVGLAFVISKQPKPQSGAETEAAGAAEASRPKQADKRIEEYLSVDPMEMEIGVGLIRLADPHRGGDLMTQVTEVRKRVAAELGIVLPKVRIRDNMRLGQREYRIKLAGDPVAEGVAFPNKLLAIANGVASHELNGIPADDPVTGREAFWIEPDEIRAAQKAGYTAMDPTALLTRHLQQVVTDHAAELLTRDATKLLIDELRKTSPAVIDELIPGVLKLGEVQQVLQSLLREGVPIRQLGVILEALGDQAVRTHDTVALTEYVRSRLARTISTLYRDAERRLRVVTFGGEFEDQIAAGIQHTDHGLAMHFSPQTVQEISATIEHETDALLGYGGPRIILVNPDIRAAIKRITAATLPHLVVLSYDEITPDTIVESLPATLRELAPAA